jgi:hypothetical protein
MKESEFLNSLKYMVKDLNHKTSLQINSNDNNQLDLPFKFPNSGQNPYLTSGNFEATKISVGYDHAIGFIKSSGITFLTGWGGNNYRQTYVADKNFYYIDCEAGIETTYLLDSAFRIHGFGKDLMESDVGLATGTIINWNYIYDNKSWPQGYSAYPRRFRQLSAGSGYLLAIDSLRRESISSLFQYRI